MRDYVFFLALAIFWVYNQRQHRWTAFLGALGGRYKLPSKKS